MEEEQFNQIRKRLEKLVEEERKKCQKAIKDNISVARDCLPKSLQIEFEIRHEYYMNGINTLLKEICKDYDIPYEPIKSEIKID